MELRKRRLRVLCACLLAALLLGTVLPGAAFAARQGSGGKIINVVYDDSRSMYMYENSRTRWCKAKYALEVFCAMMGAEDEMNIYSMNRPEVVSLRGSDPGRVETVHAMTSMYGGTPFSKLKAAGDALLAADASRERWLVVLTDGEFDDGMGSHLPIAVVQTALDEYNAQGLKSVYLTMGDGATPPRGNPAANAYVEQALDTKDILQKVTKIANQIFEHLVIGDSFISSRGRATELNVDIPTSQIIVFAQGERASVGEMSLNGKELTPTSSFTVRHSGDVMPLNTENFRIEVDKSLHGVVVTYDAGSTPFEKGVFSLVVSNATAVEYYYRPGVTVDCALYMEGQPIRDGGRLYAGECEVALRFIDPLTGEPAESELLKQASFTLTVTNNGEEQTLSGTSGSITLEEGVADVYATAELPGSIFLQSARSYTVLPKPLRLGLELTPPAAEYKAVTLDSAEPVLVRVTNAETGQPLSDEEYARLSVRAEELAGVGWTVRPAGETGVWALMPRSLSGTPDGVVSGDYEVGVSASFELDERAGYGAAPLRVKLLEYGGSRLEVKIEPPPEAYELGELSAGAPMRVTVRYEDPETGEFMPLTEAMWQSFTLTASSDSRVDWKLERGGEVGVWLLRPGYYRGDPVLTDSGRIEVNVSASGQDGWLRFEGEGSQKADFNKLSWLELIKILGPRVLAALLLLLIIIGHLTKKRLRLRGLNPRCHFKGTDSPKRKISKHFFSVILPFVPERATVYCQKSAFQCNFSNLQIEAAGRHSFRITNKSYPLTTTKICGQFVADMPTLHKLSFAFGSFDLTSVDRRTRKSLGRFTFL